jgi:hypothetical protein
MEGKMQLDSREGQGTKVQLLLPAVIEDVVVS